MGRLNNDETKPESVHFSHVHPLQLTANLPHTKQANCFGCGMHIVPGKECYACISCDFYLDTKCYEFPSRYFNHRADPNHELILVVSSCFQCKACGNPSRGFSYNCRICNQSYHGTCLFRPLEVFHKRDPHPLRLEFSSPYGEGEGFRCDICGQPGGDSWLYCCRLCGFDIHLDCANAEIPEIKPQVQNINNPQQTQHAIEANLVTVQTLPSNNLPQFPQNVPYLSQPSMPNGFMLDNNPHRMVANNDSNFTNSLTSVPQYMQTVNPYVNQGGSSTIPSGVQTPCGGGNFVYLTSTTQSRKVALSGPNTATPMGVQYNQGAAYGGVQGNQGVAYGTPTYMGYNNQGGTSMSGVRGMVIAGALGGATQVAAQEMFQGMANGFGSGGSSGDI